MNADYTSAVLAVMAIFAGINWGVYARRKYNGPRLQLNDEEM
jgi:choline transport protein